MKKIILLALILAAACVSAIYIRSQNGRLVLNNERFGLILTKGRYRSYSLCYSDGLQQQPDGSWKNLWKFPAFYRVDMKYLNPQ